MPTVSLDEFADGEIEKMNQAQESEKQSKIRAQQAEDEDSDRDSVGDEKQEKARHWDDWKDEHEKGAGNKGGRWENTPPPPPLHVSSKKIQRTKKLLPSYDASGGSGGNE